jgi:repressor LexA
MLDEIHPRRLEILQFLARRQREGEPPSTREIAAGVGGLTASTVHQHLARLRDDGLLERTSGAARGARLTEAGWELVGQIPMMGRTAAGRGLEAVPAEEAYSLSAQLLLSRDGSPRYLLRVVGDSMVEAKISDGDLVVVEPDSAPEDGAIVVALLSNGEVTVKRISRKNSHVLLRAESPNHSNIEVEWGEVEVQGRVVYVIHSTEA